MNSYLISILRNNCFYVQSEICLHGKTLNGNFKIDTGCGYSTISYRVLCNLSHNAALNYKEQAIISGLRYQRSYGVSDSEEIKEKDRQLIIEGRLTECTALKFTHENVRMSLNGYELIHDIAVNYDRTGNILIGMDILKDFDFHCGTSKIIDEYIFIGCMKRNITQDYLNALQMHFGYGIVLEA